MDVGYVMQGVLPYLAANKYPYRILAHAFLNEGSKYRTVADKIVKYNASRSEHTRCNPCTIGEAVRSRDLDIFIIAFERCRRLNWHYTHSFLRSELRRGELTPCIRDWLRTNRNRDWTWISMHP